MKKSLILIFCCIVSMYLRSLEAVECPPLFISLGVSCEVAHECRSCGVRNRAYPFDWLLTLDPHGLVSLLQRDFEFFLKEDHLILNSRGFYDTFYNIEFRHDLYSMDTSFEEYLPTLQEKYAKRIERFRQLALYQGKVYFFRSAYPPHYPPLTTSESECFAITLSQAKALKEALYQLFPTLDFTLVIINYSGISSDTISGIDKVIECKIGRDAASLRDIIQRLQAVQVR